jgi:tetratricopeptide (TPR) repeat protein
MLVRCTLLVGVFVCLALAGCDQGKPLEAIRKQHAAGDFEGTLETLRELLEERPEDPELNYLYGRALAFTQPNLAVWSLRKAMEDPEWLVPAGSQLAFVALSGGDFNEVVKITSRILEREPDNIPVLMIQANAYAHSKLDPERAMADAKHILELDPRTPEAYEPLILALLSLDRLDEASEALAEAGRLLAELDVNEGLLAWHCATTAAFVQESGDLADARKTWAACIDAHPSDLDVVSNAVNFYDAQGEIERSIEILRAALAENRVSPQLRSILSQHLLALGDAAGAEAVLREATRSDDPLIAAGAWMDLAKFEQGLEEYAAAADAMERSIELLKQAGDPSPQVLFEYADALVLADRLERALEVAEELPVVAHKQLIRGRVAQEQRDPARALEEFDEALALWPDNPWARYYAALAAEELGDFERAVEEYRNAVRGEPGATDARTRGAALLLAEGDPSSASLTLKTAIDEAPLEIEGQLLGIRTAGVLGDTVDVSEWLAMIEKNHPAWSGQALAEAAEGVARRSGPIRAVNMLATAPGVDYGNPRYAAGLRALVKFSHEATENPALRDAFAQTFGAHPDSAQFQAIAAYDLELSGAPSEEVVARYARALELEPEHPWALAGLGRLALANDPEAALGYFDRAAAKDSDDPESKLQAARALLALGKQEEAAVRLDALLLEHPAETSAAIERARLDLDRGISTPQTLERARRAVHFGGGADALELLSRVHAEREEPELAERAATQAQAVRAAQTSEDK